LLASSASSTTRTLTRCIYIDRIRMYLRSSGT
jgi:hypothetical protein